MLLFGRQARRISLSRRPGARAIVRSEITTLLQPPLLSQFTVAPRLILPITRCPRLSVSTGHRRVGVPLVWQDYFVAMVAGCSPHIWQGQMGVAAFKWANVLPIFHLSNFPYHTQEEMLLHYTKLHSFLFYKFPALSTLQIPLYLFIQRNLLPCSLH